MSGTFVTPITSSLDVNFIGLPDEVFEGEIITLTASTPRDMSLYDLPDNIPPSGIFYPINRYSISNNYEFHLSKLGTQSVNLLQGDASNQSAGLKVKQVVVKENPIYILTGGGSAPIPGSPFTVRTRKYSSDGNLIWAMDNEPVSAIAIDASGNFHTGGARVNNLTTRKYDSVGDLIWSVDHGTVVNRIAVDASGNVYTGGLRTSQTFADDNDNGQRVTTRKYDSAGDLIWSVDHELTVNSIAVDASGNVYTGGARAAASSFKSTRKYDSDGDLIWSVDHGTGVNGIAVDASGNVYTGGFRTSNLTTRKYDSAGDLIWSVDHGATVREIAVDASGNVYTVGARTSNLTTRKYDSDGDLIWSVDFGAGISFVREIAVDKQGNVYTVGDRSTVDNITTRKYDSEGNLIWSVDHGSFVNGIDTFPPNKGAFLS